MQARKGQLTSVSTIAKPDKSDKNVLTRESYGRVYNSIANTKRATMIAENSCNSDPSNSLIR